MKEKKVRTYKLPMTRFMLFWDILKTRLFLLLSIGLTVLVFSIPFIITITWYNSAITSIATTLDEADTYTKMFSALNIRNLIFILCALVLSLGLAGIFQILRNLVWGEGVIFWADFKKGLKENSLTFMFCALLLGILNFFLQYIYFLNVANSFEYRLVLAVAIAVTVLSIPIIMLVLVQSTIYNLKLSYRFKNAFLLAMRRFYLTIPLALLNASIFFLFLIPNRIVYLILIYTIPVVISPLILLINILINDAILDEFINKDNFPSVYRKGINYEDLSK